MELRAGAAERRDRVDHDHIRPEALQVAVHARQMHLQSVEAGPGGFKPQQAAFSTRLQVQPDGKGIPADFVGALLEHEKHAALAACTGGVSEMTADCLLPVPATPDSRMPEPLKNPPVSSIVSSPGMPLGTISLETGLWSPDEVTGSTLMP